MRRGNRSFVTATIMRWWGWNAGGRALKTIFSILLKSLPSNHNARKMGETGGSQEERQDLVAEGGAWLIDYR